MGNYGMFRFPPTFPGVEFTSSMWRASESNRQTGRPDNSCGVFFYFASLCYLFSSLSTYYRNLKTVIICKTLWCHILYASGYYTGDKKRWTDRLPWPLFFCCEQRKPWAGLLTVKMWIEKARSECSFLLLPIIELLFAHHKHPEILSWLPGEF